HLSATFPYPFRITVADNASTDGTLAVARRLAAELPRVGVLHLDAKGRGRALAAAWSASPAPVLAYCDVDLSTDLAALLPLVAPLISGHSDLAIGTRLLGRALAAGTVPLAALRRQLGRHPLEPATPGVPVGLARQLVRFAGVGIASTAAYLLLFVTLRGVLGAQPANLAALLLTALANTAVNRRFTFGVTGRRSVTRHHAQGLVAFAAALAFTS